MSEAAAGKGHSDMHKNMKGSAPQQNDVRGIVRKHFLTSNSCEFQNLSS